ncbi:hypothetical protein B0H14DRAFT_2633707 [Mycena olivaceomarginata]|nr:hypothetical protein B0H14DRAFT_2633707 [Mycena olivaceomarginata]
MMETSVGLVWAMPLVYSKLLVRHSRKYTSQAGRTAKARLGTRARMAGPRPHFNIPERADADSSTRATTVDSLIVALQASEPNMGFLGDIKSKRDETILRNIHQPQFQPSLTFSFHFERTIMSTSTHSQSQKKLILVIGATGAQGTGSHRRAARAGRRRGGPRRTLFVRSRETLQTRSQMSLQSAAVWRSCRGSFMDFESIARGAEGAYGAW